MQNIEKNLSHIRQQIDAIAKTYQRRASNISLLAVSKKKPAEDIRKAYLCGQRDFGENYLQEAQQKIETLSDLDICWHFIGPVQSNKTKTLALHFDWVHCVDRFKIARRLSEQRPQNLPPLNLCIQVNVNAEPSKSGIALNQVGDLAQQIDNLANVRLRGLMTIPEQRHDLEAQRQPFSLLRKALQELNAEGLSCDTLSMGMSHDMTAAIAEGATLVRIGTAIFGERL